MAKMTPQLPGTMIVDGPQSPWEAALAEYQQALVDLDGDGIPDGVMTPGGQFQPLNNDIVSTAQSVRPSDRARMRQAGNTPVQDPAGEGRLGERWNEALTRRIPAAAMGAADPMGIPSYGVGMVSPAAGQWMRDIQSADPDAAMVGGLATPIAAKGAGAIVNAARLNPMLTGGTLAGATVATPTEAGQETPYDQQMRSMTEQQAALRQTAEKLRNNRRALVEAADIESASGKGRNYQIKQQAVTDWDQANGQQLTRTDAQIAAMDERIKAYEDENGPAAVRKRGAQMSTKDLYPSATIGTQALLAAGGLGASMAMKGRAVGRYNSSIDDMSAGLTSANAAGRTAEASALTARLNDMIKKGPSSSGTVLPTVAGFELGAFAPTFGDYFRSGGDPSSPLYQKAMGSMTGVTNVKALGFDIPIPDLATRIAMAGLAGAGASKIANRAVEGAMGLRNAPHTAMVQAEVNGRGTGSGGGNTGGPTTGPGGPGPQGGGGGGGQTNSPQSYPAYRALPSDIKDAARSGYVQERALTGNLLTGEKLPPSQTAQTIKDDILGRYNATVPVTADRVSTTNKAVDAFVQQYGRLPTKAEFAEVFNSRTLAIPLAAGAAAGPVNDMLNYYQGQ